MCRRFLGGINNNKRQLKQKQLSKINNLMTTYDILALESNMLILAIFLRFVISDTNMF